jgi:hypothetical protein
VIWDLAKLCKVELWREKEQARAHALAKGAPARMCICHLRELQRHDAPAANNRHPHSIHSVHLEVTEMLLSDTLALTAAGLAAIVVMHHHTQQQQQQRRALQRRNEMRPVRNRQPVYRYRPALPVPVGPQFDLDSYNDVFCVEYFRWVMLFFERAVFECVHELTEM